MELKPTANPRRRTHAVVVAAATFILSSCTGECLFLPAPTIIISVTDSTTGLSPTSDLLVRVSDGATEDTLEAKGTPPPSVPYVPTFSSETPAGIFRITVSADGYQTFVREGVRVEPTGYCGQNSQVTIAVRLQPIGAPS